MLVAPECLWSCVSNQVCENQLERELDLVIGGFGMTQLVTLAQGTQVAVWQRPVEPHPIVVQALQTA